MEREPIDQNQLEHAVETIVTAPRFKEFEEDRGEFLGRIKSGHEVYDRPAASHMRSHGGVHEFLPKAFEQMETPEQVIPNERLDFTVDMGEVIGQTECVAVKEGDRVVYAIRKGRVKQGVEYTRFVLGREPEDCSSVVAVVYQPPQREYLLLATAFIGRPAAREVYESYLRQRPDLKEKSLKFWMGIGGDEGDLGHALLFNPELLEPGLPVLTECPYDLSLAPTNPVNSFNRGRSFPPRNSR